MQHLDRLVDMLHAAGYKITIETQGTIFREWIRKCDKVTVSPKPPSSGNITSMREVHVFSQLLRPRLVPDPSAGIPTIVEALPDGQLSYKVVVFDEEDVEYLRELVRFLEGKHPVFLSIGNDVGRDTTSDLLDKWRTWAEWIGQDEELSTVRVLPQGHVLLWGNARGV
jgi:7-carboxy-7-deazaguanine synthase